MYEREEETIEHITTKIWRDEKKWMEKRRDLKNKRRLVYDKKHSKNRTVEQEWKWIGVEKKGNNRKSERERKHSMFVWINENDIEI